MTKRETFSLLSMIQAYYDQFEVDQMKVDVWHKALKSYEMEDLGSGHPILSPVIS